MYEAGISKSNFFITISVYTHHPNLKTSVDARLAKHSGNVIAHDGFNYRVFGDHFVDCSNDLVWYLAKRS